MRSPSRNNPASRVIIPTGITLVLFVCAFAFGVLPFMHESLLRFQKEKMKELTNSALTLIEGYENDARDGLFTVEEAKSRCLSRLGKIRYGRGGVNYFWVTDNNNRMLIHPHRQDLLNIDILNYRDPMGKLLFSEYMQLARKQGSGYVEYHWPLPNDPDTILPKMLYVQRFEPWGWFVCTGAYIDNSFIFTSARNSLAWIGFLFVLGWIVFLSTVTVKRGLATERHRSEAERSLRSWQKRQKAIIDFLPDAIMVVDRDGKMIAWNKAMENLSGIPAAEAIGLDQRDVAVRLLGPEGKLLLTHILFPDEPVDNEAIRFDKKGDRWVIEAFVSIFGENRKDLYLYVTSSALLNEKGEVVGAIESIKDITARMRMEESIIQSEKMLSVGGLAAGMAHEINNPLAGMLQSAQVVENRLSETLPRNHTVAEECDAQMSAISRYAEKREIRRLLESLTDSGRRAASIVENMLSFARKSAEAFSTADIADLLETTIDLASSSYDLKKKYDFKKIDIQRDYPPEPVLVNCDGGKMQQVFLNILSYCAESMSESGIASPTLRIRLRGERDEAVLSISNDGPGMSEEARRRIFEPFFTTTGASQGNGLGLSVAYFIITENHGGEMRVESSPNTGTTFHINLPKQL